MADDAEGLLLNFDSCMVFTEALEAVDMQICANDKTSTAWSHEFLVAVTPSVENSTQVSEQTCWMQPFIWSPRIR